MLSMTETDARISLATPDDVRAVSEQALNIWTGALSPFWLPFWAASTVGIGLWGLGQSLKRGFSGLAPADGDALLATKWPGFALTLPSVAEKAVEPVVTKAAEIVAEAPKVVAKAAKKAVETVTEITEPVVAQTAEIVEDVQDAVVETVETALPAATTETAKVIEDATEIAADNVEAVSDTVAEKAVEVAASTPLIDPVTEVPVVPEVVEDTAETDLFKPLSATVAPKRGKKR